MLCLQANVNKHTVSHIFIPRSKKKAEVCSKDKKKAKVAEKVKVTEKVCGMVDVWVLT